MFQKQKHKSILSYIIHPAKIQAMSLQFQMSSNNNPVNKVDGTMEGYSIYNHYFQHE